MQIPYLSGVLMKFRKKNSISEESFHTFSHEIHKGCHICPEGPDWGGWRFGIFQVWFNVPKRKNIYLKGKVCMCVCSHLCTEFSFLCFLVVFNGTQHFNLIMLFDAYTLASPLWWFRVFHLSVVNCCQWNSCKFPFPPPP